MEHVQFSASFDAPPLGDTNGECSAVCRDHRDAILASPDQVNNHRSAVISQGKSTKHSTSEAYGRVATGETTDSQTRAKAMVAASSTSAPHTVSKHPLLFGHVKFVGHLDLLVKAFCRLASSETTLRLLGRAWAFSIVPSGCHRRPNVISKFPPASSQLFSRSAPPTMFSKRLGASSPTVFEHL